MTQNIDLFNEYVAIILGRLYENFPVRQDLMAWEISGHTRPKGYGDIFYSRKDDSEDVDEEKQKQMRIAFSTIDWLVENGYVRALQRGGLQVNGCMLTEKALKLLNSIPDGVQQPDETFGKILARLIKEGGIDAAKGLVTQLFTSGLT